jgi:hypothetical protein
MNNPTYRFIGAILAAVLLALCVMEGQVAWARINNDITTGSGSGSSVGYPFALTGNATSTLTQFNGGLTAYASSTIGNGNQNGGLTVNGGATTTANAYFASRIGIGVQVPTKPLQINAPASGEQNLIFLHQPNGGVGDDISIVFQAAGIGLGSKILAHAPGASGNDLEFFTSTAGVQNSTPTLYLNGVNNFVGIGSTTPRSKLSVQSVYGETVANLFSVASSIRSTCRYTFCGPWCEAHFQLCVYRSPDQKEKPPL